MSTNDFATFLGDKFLMKQRSFFEVFLKEELRVALDQVLLMRLNSKAVDFCLFMISLELLPRLTRQSFALLLQHPSRMCAISTKNLPVNRLPIRWWWATCRKPWLKSPTLRASRSRVSSKSINSFLTSATLGQWWRISKFVTPYK